MSTKAITGIVLVVVGVGGLSYLYNLYFKEDSQNTTA